MGLVRLDLGLGGPARPAHAVCTGRRRVGPPATDRAALEPGRIGQQHDPAGSGGGPGRVSPDAFLRAVELINLSSGWSASCRFLDLINLGPNLSEGSASFIAW